MLTVLVSTKLNSQVFLLKKFAKATHIYSAKILAIFNDQSFNDTLTNNIVSFEQLGPELYNTATNKRSIQMNIFLISQQKHMLWVLRHF